MTLIDAAKEWIARWGKPDSAAFAELYADDGAYVDPAFGVHAKGRPRIHRHHQAWWKAVPDFELRAEQFHVADRSPCWSSMTRSRSRSARNTTTDQFFPVVNRPCSMRLATTDMCEVGQNTL